MKSLPGILVVFVAIAVHAALAQVAPGQLRVGIVQMSLGCTVAANRDRIVAGISNAAARQVRVAVFPEGALRGSDGNQPGLVEQAVSDIRQAARRASLFVLFGGSTYSATLKKDANWLQVIGPDGHDVFRYEKLYDVRRARMPGVFLIDGIPCSAIICADRWLRGIEEIPVQQGAQISFELSCNFASEWVEAFSWYWYVPRALRNNIWVIFANTGNRIAGTPDDPSSPRELRHGHSAIIAPDGRLAAASHNDAETLVVCDVDVSRATRAEALARSSHPALKGFWRKGMELQKGGKVDATPLSILQAPETDITLAVAQVTQDLDSMERMIGRARSNNADLIAFPARAIVATALARLQAAARHHRIAVVVGMEQPGAAGRLNSAFVIGPDGLLLTRYDQLSAKSPFLAGDRPSSMWFHVKGVPAVVTLEEDRRWTELVELAAVAGAQIHIHLDHDPLGDAGSKLRRLQEWVNLASYQTFTVTANVTDSAIWDDLRGAEERRAEVYDLPRPNTGSTVVYSPFSANLVSQAEADTSLLIATRRTGVVNRYHPARTSNFNPQMDTWYRLGAAIICAEKVGNP